MAFGKRLLALFMSIVMVCCVGSFQVFAEEDTVQPNDMSSIASNTNHESLGDETNEITPYVVESPVEYTVPFYGRTSLGDDTSNVNRDIVLVLDNSISMEGVPLVSLKEAAIKFCISILAAKGINRVAIVAYDTDVLATTEFTDNIDILSTSINSMDGKGDWTNIAAGVQKADELLQASVSDIKNIIVMTDGVATAGQYSSNGPYKYEDYSGTHNASHYVFEYSNALYDIATTLLGQYNIYTLGFFHNASEEVKTFASRVMSDIQNAGYYEVINPDDLEFTFGEVADDITQEQLRKLYVDQHVAYYNGNYENDIQQIDLPDEEGNTRKNTNYLLGNLVLDAAEDNVSTNYNVASIFSDILNLDVDFVDGAVGNYELILADIVTSPYYKDILKEACIISTMSDTISMLQDMQKYFSECLDKLAIKAEVSVDTLRQEWQTLAQTLDQMKVCENPREFAALYGKCSIVVDKYIKNEEQLEFLHSLNGKKGYRESALKSVDDAILGAVVNTATEAMTYYSCYDAYCSASDTFKEILTLIGFHASSVVQTGADGNPIYIGGLDEVFYCTSLSAAIKNFLDNANQESTTTQAIAEKFARVGIENLISEFAESCVDELLDCIPIVGKLNEIRKAVGFASETVLVTIDWATKIDDRAYAASMIYHLYFLANCTAKVTEDCGSILVNEKDPEQAFEWAYRFDEAVRIWRCCSIMICDLGIEFESYCLQSAQKKLRPWPNSAMEDASWHSTAITIAALEKKLLSDVHCHSVNLSYNPSSGVIDWHQNAQIVMIACPVTVCVTDENNKQIALLEDENKTIEAGYEPYFYVLETERGNNDYMKICYVPDGWKITFTGTSTGIMHVLKADIVDGRIQNPIDNPEVYISEGTSGHILCNDDENIVVIDDIGMCTVTFNANGGNIVSDLTMQTNKDGKLTSLPNKPIREGGYIFTGWYTAFEGGTQVTTDYVFSTDTTVYAQWSKMDYSGSNAENDSDSGNGSEIPTSTNPTANANSLSVKSPATGEASVIQLYFAIFWIVTIGLVVTIWIKKGVWNSKKFCKSRFQERKRKLRSKYLKDNR